ncbi:hypothetical protein D3C80_2131260 [compost metagenome]
MLKLSPVKLSSENVFAKSLITDFQLKLLISGTWPMIRSKITVTSALDRIDESEG